MITHKIGEPTGSIIPITFTDELGNTYHDFLLSWATDEQQEQAIERKRQIAEIRFDSKKV